MSEQEPQPVAPPEDNGAEAPKGAFAKDKQFGNRLDQAFALREPFLLLGWKEGETIDTKFGAAVSVKLLVQRLDADSGQPKGSPFPCVTVATAVVEKVKALTSEELKAGPVVCVDVVRSKARDTNAFVLQWLRNLADADDYSEFGLDSAAVSQVTDLARPAGERIPY